VNNQTIAIDSHRHSWKIAICGVVMFFIWSFLVAWFTASSLGYYNNFWELPHAFFTFVSFAPVGGVCVLLWRHRLKEHSGKRLVGLFMLAFCSVACFLFVLNFTTNARLLFLMDWVMLVTIPVFLCGFLCYTTSRRQRLDVLHRDGG
jgi:peptidoglycan/LPS O-acetylase OafA/YrhL